MFFRKEKSPEDNTDRHQSSASYRIINQPNGDIYEGYLKDEKFHGLGTLYYSNKCFFKGYFKEGEKDRGIQTFPNGDEYTGIFKNDKFHGEGILENKRIGFRYEGEFKAGIKEGTGNEKYMNGTIYVGEFKKNMKNGRGKLSKIADGTTYEGHFYNGMMHGYGIQILSNKLTRRKTLERFTDIKEKLNESFENLEEKKIKEFAENVEDKGAEDSFYEGEFCLGYRHGIGRYYYKKGSYIYGEWRFDKSIGNVLFYFADENKWQLSFFDISEKETVLKIGEGSPPIKLDAYKSMIDECGIKSDKLEDHFFPNNVEMLGMKMQLQEEINFVRISDLYKKEKYELFCENIKPGKFFLNSYVSMTELTCLDTLCNYPHLIFKLFTPKYSLDIGYFILKLYIDGNWKEVLVDDYIPCVKNQTVLCTNFKEDIGWLVLQKAIAKTYGSYFSDTNDRKITDDFLKLLTGLPVKVLPCSNISACMRAMEKYHDNKVKFIHLKDEFYDTYNIQKNMPFILKDYLKINEQNGIFIIKTLDGDLKIPEKLDLTSINRDYYELLKTQIPYLDEQHVHCFENVIFKEIFSDIAILLGTDNYIQNSAKFSIFCEEKDDLFLHDKYTFDFKITASSKVLINIEQLVHSEDQLLPLRINLAKLREEQGSLRKNTKLPKNKFLYIFGKGQYAKKDIHKEIYLESGTYYLYLEFEVNKSITLFKRYININIFSPFLLKINKRLNMSTFKHKIYKNLITKTYDISLHENRDIKNFSHLDLKNKTNNGSDELIILQYFLKKEGTYLHYLMNKSKNRKWKQKLNFKLENMKIIKEFDSSDLDLILEPGNKILIIIQQVQGLNYGLEGGDGPCLIDIIEEPVKEKQQPQLFLDLDKKK